MSNLHQTINALASEFAHSLLRALRGASLDEILAETAHGHAATAPTPKGTARAPKSASPATHRGGKRLHRRSAKELETVVGHIVALLKTNKKGLRAEDIRSKLHLDRRELVGPLTEALAKKVVTKKGKKRATTYFA